MIRKPVFRFLFSDVLTDDPLSSLFCFDCESGEVASWMKEKRFQEKHEDEICSHQSRCSTLA